MPQLGAPWPNELAYPLAVPEDAPHVHASGLPPKPPTRAPPLAEGGHDLVQGHGKGFHDVGAPRARQLVELLNRRAEASLRIGRLKSHSRLGVYQPEREVMVYTNVLAASRGPLPDDLLKTIFDAIVNASKELQRRRLG